MKTQIFNSYEDFLKRKDKRINGVTRDFAERYPNYRAMNKTNEGCFSCTDCLYCSECSYCDECLMCKGCKGCQHSSKCENCKVVTGCTNCTDCLRCDVSHFLSDCVDCKFCVHCYSCYSCAGCEFCTQCFYSVNCYNCKNLFDSKAVKNKRELYTLHKVPDIHEKVFKITRGRGNKLSYELWGGRESWVIKIAGGLAKEVSEKTDEVFTAMLIYELSSSISVKLRTFYGSEKRVERDIKRCYNRERKLKNEK